MSDWPAGNIAAPQPQPLKQRTIDPREMDDALRRIRTAEQEARRAVRMADSQACYAALERCQFAAFDAKALFNGVRLPDANEGM